LGRGCVSPDWEEIVGFDGSSETIFVRSGARRDDTSERREEASVPAREIKVGPPQEIRRSARTSPLGAK